MLFIFYTADSDFMEMLQMFIVFLLLLLFSTLLKFLLISRIFVWEKLNSISSHAPTGTAPNSPTIDSVVLI